MDADHQNQDIHLEAAEANTAEASKSPRELTHPTNAATKLSQLDGRSEICVSPSWATDKERREKKRELKRLAREKKELERFLKLESRNTDQGSVREPRRLTKKPPSNTPSRSSSIKSYLPRSSTAPSVLAFWSNSASKANSTNEPDTGHSAPPPTGAEPVRTSLETMKPIFTGHWPYRFGMKTTQVAANNNDPSGDLNSVPPQSMPSNPSDIPGRQLHATKKHADLRAAANFFRLNGSGSQPIESATSKTSWSKEVNRQLSVGGGKKLRRKSLKAEHEPHMYSLRRGPSDKNGNDTKSSGQLENSTPSTTECCLSPTALECLSPSLQNDSQSTVFKSAESIYTLKDITNQQNSEASLTKNAPKDAVKKPASKPPSRPQKAIKNSAGNQRGHGRRPSWSEIFKSSNRGSSVTLKCRVQSLEPAQKMPNGEVSEFKTSGPYESAYSIDDIFASPIFKLTNPIKEENGLVSTKTKNAVSDLAQVQPQTDSNQDITQAKLSPEHTLIQETTPVTDSPSLEPSVNTPNIRRPENTIRLVSKPLNSDSQFKSSPLAAPPLNTQEDEASAQSGQISKCKSFPSVISPVAAPQQLEISNGKSLLFFTRLLGHTSKKDQTPGVFDSRSTKKPGKAVTSGKGKEKSAPMTTSTEPPKPKDEDGKAAAKSPNSVDDTPPASADICHNKSVSLLENPTNNDFQIPPKSSKRNNGRFPTSSHRKFTSSVELPSTTSDGIETRPQKKHSISIEIPKSQLPLDSRTVRHNSSRPSSSQPSPALSSRKSTPTISSLHTSKHPKINPMAPSDFPSYTTLENQTQTTTGPIYDARLGSSSRQSLASSVGGSRAAAQRPARKGTPVAKMFVICCQCKYWHDMPSDVYAKLAFPHGVPATDPLFGDDQYSSRYQQQVPMASGALSAQGGGSSSTVTETSSGASNNNVAMDNKSPRGSRPSSSSSSSSNNFTVTCCWCAHRMVKICCAGWTTIVYLHERHH
ncbi:hypothetical protein PAAG_08333 [Paracoccidioides lutzii Pb01]|uniref:Uncharacterized protein n=1 Tax=Paracoccidioides lutzii (strain ATCC MYA-826 / Pb01) TaxID=502779 RepID=C1HC42_PARBA|nr:hypothetical protein PAAG_08333 [Paracoccidioides lutzii Pb01]EEH38606.2 hypothetical protein PAAG_08333 [Paracoccidioides lutzii Pb01]